MSYGSFHNLLAGNSKSLTEIEIGMGATQIGWSDRLAYTVVGIETYKAIILAGTLGVATVVEKLARAFLDDGKLTVDEINAAFSAVDKKAAK